MKSKKHGITVILLILFLGPLSLFPQKKAKLSLSPKEDENLKNAIIQMQGASAEMGQMGAIYQTMYALLNQVLDSKKDKVLEIKQAKNNKFQVALEQAKNKQEEIKERVEAARDQYVSACIRAVAQCLSTIASVATEGVGGATGFLETPSRRIVLKYVNNIQSALKSSKKLQNNILKLAKDSDNYPYTPSQKRQIRGLLIKLNQLKSNLDQKKKDNDDYLSKLKSKKRKRKKN